jgi:hypothetical protein
MAKTADGVAVVVVPNIGLGPNGFQVYDYTLNRIVDIRCWCGSVYEDRVHLVGKPLKQNENGELTLVEFPNGQKVWCAEAVPLDV